MNTDMKAELQKDLKKVKEPVQEEDSDIALGLALGVNIPSSKRKPFQEKTNAVENSPTRSLKKSLSSHKLTNNSKSPEKSPVLNCVFSRLDGDSAIKKKLAGMQSRFTLNKVPSEN
jgi:hypothetical protein